MVRALYQGAAAADPGREGALGGCSAGLVVVRDDEARPVREALPLRLPKEMAEQAQGESDTRHENRTAVGHAGTERPAIPADRRAR